MFVHRTEGLFLSVFVGDVRMAIKKQNMAPMWKKLMNNADIDEPMPFLDHMYLVCSQRDCEPNGTIIEQYTKMFEKMFELRIFGGTADNYRDGRKRDAQNCVERYCELANCEIGATVQSFSSLFGRPSVQKEGVGISCTIVRSFLTSCLELVVVGTNWTTWHLVIL